MPARHILSIASLTPADVATIVGRSLDHAAGRLTLARPLAGRTVGIYFRQTSTRTRTAFTVGAAKLGASTIAYGPHDLQTNTGESVSDTARVLAGYLDALVIRTSESLDEMRTLAAAQDDMAVINALSENEHPTQAFADLSAMRERFGHLDHLRVLYIGEGNNTASALALAVSRIPGVQLTVVTPSGYGLSDETLRQARALGCGFGSRIEQHHRIDDLPSPVDVVYTTRWQTMGTSKADPDWRHAFVPFKVTSALLRAVSEPSTVFMHDLPAMRGDEVEDDVLDGPHSIAFRQARHKMFSAMAALEWCLGTC